ALRGAAQCRSCPTRRSSDLAARVVQLPDREALPGRGVEERCVELRLVGLEFEEELEDLVVDPERLRIRTVDLVDDDDRLEPQGRSEEHTSELQSREKLVCRL